MAKKVLSIALALLMVVNVFAVAVSATEWTTENAVITLTTDNAKPQPGDEVTVTVALQNNYNVHALQIMMAYDKGYYEVVGATAGEIFTDLLADETARFTGVAQSLLAADAQEEMYAGLYSDAQKAQYGLLRVGYVWLASLGAVNTRTFETATNLVSFKLKVKADAPTDGKGVIMVDPTFVVETGVDTPAFDTRSATYVGKGAATVVDSATEGKLYGLPINVDGAKFEGCVHAAGDAVVENEVAADCTTAGSYDTVVYCTLCGDEISRETTTVSALGHTAGEAATENEVAADCTTDGSYDTVVYCTVCGEEISRETTTVDALGHTPAEAVEENRVEATAKVDGSYDSVVYCTVCGEEISRETKVIPALGHEPAEAVEENRVEATCTEDGSYDLVVYCTCCTPAEELSRETKVIPALGHSYETEVTAPTCTEAGYTTYTCSVCGGTYKADEVAALGHTEAEAVVENNVDPTCTEEGSYDTVVYCTVCGEELSREPITVDALGHTPADAVEENRVEATYYEAGSYDLVVYCTVCGEELSRETVAIPATGEPDADYTELNALVEEAEAIDRTAYTDDSLAAVDAVLAKIEDGLKESQQSIVDGWAEELEAALEGLERDASKATAKVSVVLDKASAEKDDVITVTVKLTTNYYVATAQLPILYDKTQFELVNFTSGSSYLTWADGAFANGTYTLGGNANQTAGFSKTSNNAYWNTDDAKSKYDYAWITAASNAFAAGSNFNLIIPQDEVLVTFQVKALEAVEDTTASIFISPEWTKTADTNKTGLFFISYATAADDKSAYNYISTGIDYTLETIAVEGVTVSGTVTSYDDKIAENSDDVTIEFFAEGSDEAVYTATATGSGAQQYSIDAVAPGTYTVKVSKANHVTRTYEVVVDDEAVSQDLKIHLLGDINGDGRANTVDVARANANAKGTTSLTGYEFDCANINGDSRVNTVDVARINAHAKGTTSLWVA